MRMTIQVIVFVVVLSATQVLAQCCAKPRGAKPACAADRQAKTCTWNDCDAMLSKLSLTDEQKAKLAEVKATCAKEATDDVAGKWCSVMAEVLTPEQKETLTGLCSAKGMKCPMQAETPEPKEAVAN
ncbi:MAG: hypothetical protein EOM20_02005 [Spartobacteria bacterium]|nr:hypothetical protein [Spartobacteria bacterium]